MPDNLRTGKSGRASRRRAGKLPNELDINLPHDPLCPQHAVQRITAIPLRARGGGTMTLKVKNKSAAELIDKFVGDGC